MDQQKLQVKLDNQVSSYYRGEITLLTMYAKIVYIPQSADEAKYISKVLPESIKNGFSDWIKEIDTEQPEKIVGVNCPGDIPVDIIKEFQLYIS